MCPLFNLELESFILFICQKTGISQNLSMKEKVTTILFMLGTGIILDSFMLLAIIAPNAHETIDRALPALTDMAEEFNALKS